MIQILTIDEKLPSLNEYINRINANRYKGDSFKKEIQQHIGWHVKASKLKPITNKVDLNIQWHESSARRDPDNIYSAVKYILDCLQDMGLLKNDTQKYIRNISNELFVGKDNKVIIEFKEVKE